LFVFLGRVARALREELDVEGHPMVGRVGGAARLEELATDGDATGDAAGDGIAAP
jgi:hypothetical protein